MDETANAFAHFGLCFATQWMTAKQIERSLETSRIVICYRVAKLLCAKYSNLDQIGSSSGAKPNISHALHAAPQ